MSDEQEQGASPLATGLAGAEAPEPPSRLGPTGGIPSAKRRIPNHIHIGPVTLRIGSRYLASWGFPRVQIGGLSIWSWTNSGDLHLASYHPRRSTTWLWYFGITARGRGYGRVFSQESRERMAEQYAKGNPYASKPRWFHRFWQPDRVRRSQWHHYAWLPFGFAIVIGRQEAMWR